MKSYKSIAVITFFSLLAKIFGVIYKIVLVALIGTIGMGYYQLVYPVFVFVFTFLSGGVATAITINIAGKKDENNSFRLFKRVSVIVFFSSVFVAICMCAFSGVIAKIQGNVDIQIVYYSVALSVVLVSLLNLYKGFLRGVEKTVVYSLAEIVEQFLKVAFSVVFAIIFKPKGISFAVSGIFLGIALSCFISIVFINLVGLKKYKIKGVKSVYNESLKDFFKCSLGLTLSLLIIPISQFLDSVIVVNMLVRFGESVTSATSLFGISRGVISAIVGAPMILISALEFVMLPAIMNTDIGKEKLSKKFILLAFFVIVPVSAVFYFFSSDILMVLYGSTFVGVEFEIAKNLLKIGAFELFFVTLVSLQNVVFQGEKSVKFTIISMSIGCVFKILFEIVFIKYLSIYAVGLSSLLFYIVVAFVNSVNLYRLKIDISSFKYLYVIYFGIVIPYVFYVFYSYFAMGSFSFIALVKAVILMTVVLAIIIVLCLVFYRGKIKEVFRSFKS